MARTVNVGRSNPYQIQVADFMPGMDAAMSGFRAGAEAKQERKATAKVQEKLDLFAKEYPEMSDVEVTQFYLKNKDVADHVKGVLGDADETQVKGDVKNAWDLYTGATDPVKFFIEKADEKMLAGQDPQPALDMAEDAMKGGEQYKKRAVAILAANDATSLKSYMDATGQTDAGSSPATDIDDHVKDAMISFDAANPNATDAERADERVRARLEVKRPQSPEQRKTRQAVLDVDAEMLPDIKGDIAGAEKTAELDVIKSMQPGITRDNEIAKYRAQEEEKRGQNIITEGVMAAEGMPNLKRGLQLLETIETGGFNTISLNVRRFFGAEEADEGELSNRLAKAVLKQLRDTFGAQFTVGEGDKLDRIEAGFNKSPANNKRLLTSALRMSQGKVDLALKRAKNTGDQSTIDEINAWVNFSLDPEDFTIEGGTKGVGADAGADNDLARQAAAELKRRNQGR
jgi:hypothetical protein